MELAALLGAATARQNSHKKSFHSLVDFLGEKWIATIYQSDWTQSTPDILHYETCMCSIIISASSAGVLYHHDRAVVNM